MKKTPQKYLLVLMALVVLASAGYSQEKTITKDQSKIEQFSSRSGSLIEKRFEDLGTVARVKLQVLTFSDMLSQAKVSGVRFEYETFERYSDTKIAFLDSDEVDALLKSIDLIQSKVLPSTPQSYTEVVYSSRSGFSAGCYYSSGKWTAFLKLEKYDSKSLVAMNSENLGQLADIVRQAKAKL